MATTMRFEFFAEYRSPGRDFLARSETGHLDLPRAIEGGMIGGLFALMAKPEHAPEGNVIKTDDGYEVIYPESFPLSAARPQIGRQLSALRAVVERSTAKMRFATTVDEITTARSQGQFSVVLHMEERKRSTRNSNTCTRCIRPACDPWDLYGAVRIFSAMASNSHFRDHRILALD